MGLIFLIIFHLLLTNLLCGQIKIKLLLNIKIKSQSLHKSQYQTPPFNTTKWIASKIASAIDNTKNATNDDDVVEFAEGYLAFF